MSYSKIQSKKLQDTINILPLQLQYFKPFHSAYLSPSLDTGLKQEQTMSSHSTVFYQSNSKNHVMTHCRMFHLYIQA
jgi:hypothetical protein